MENDIILELKGIDKSFSGVQVLKKVQFVAKEGEIHTLLGENGAGKSTVLNIMSGSLKMDAGEIYYKGQPVEIHSTLAAKKTGIIKVHQELQLIPELPVYQNIFLGNEIRKPKSKALWFSKMKEESTKLLADLDADFSCEALVINLSTAQQQLVEIAKAMLNEFTVLILDEPTSSLTNNEINKLFELMRKLKKQGKAIIFVSHRLDEVFLISDRITVYRDGQYVETMDVADTTSEKLIRLMTGRDLSKLTKNMTRAAKEEVVLSVRNFNGAGGTFKDINFDLYKGEILGIAGLVGSGRTETVRAIFGADHKISGELYLHGEPVRIASPRDSLKYGIALIPEDRKLQGMVGIIPNMNNVGLCSFQKLTKRGILKNKSIEKNATEFMKLLNVKPMNPLLHTENMSGGNQQKIVIAKWLSVGAKIILMDEPTRGIDVGAKDEIYKLMLKLVEEGASIIMISSELPEILSMSNRIMVMREGRIVSELSREEATEARVLNYAMGEDA